MFVIKFYPRALRGANHWTTRFGALAEGGRDKNYVELRRVENILGAFLHVKKKPLPHKYMQGRSRTFSFRRQTRKVENVSLQYKKTRNKQLYIYLWASCLFNLDAKNARESHAAVGGWGVYTQTFPRVLVFHKLYPSIPQPKKLVFEENCRRNALPGKHVRRTVDM